MGSEVSVALASRKEFAGIGVVAAWATAERTAGRGIGTAAATRGPAAGGAAAADRTLVPGAEASPPKRASKGDRASESCENRLCALGSSNEKRSPKAEGAGGGADRSPSSLNANSKSSRVRGLADGAR